MKFLIIAQDLRVSGTSEGIVSRSFIAKLRKVYPESVIDVLYLHSHERDDNLNVLPVNTIVDKRILFTIPFHVKWISRFCKRIFLYDFAQVYIYKKFAKEILKINYSTYDHIIVRSAGLNHETILAMHNLPILKHSIINFHDPYPISWYKGSSSTVNLLQLKKLQKVIEIVAQAKTCSTSAYNMSEDLQYLYASDKFFHTLPHQFSPEVFDLKDFNSVRKKTKKIQISYHGALMFGRNPFILVEAFKQLVEENEWINNDVELVMRVKGDGVEKLKEFGKSCKNIFILDTLNFSNSSNEQIQESDINIILENGPLYCNILGGKVPFLISLDKKIIILSPKRSELRRSFSDYPYICDMNDLTDIKLKLFDILTTDYSTNSIGKEIFSESNFKKSLEMIFKNKSN